MLPTAIERYLDRARTRRRLRAAQAWVVRLDAGALPERRRARFQAWMDSPANADAFRRAAKLWEGIDLAVTGHPVPLSLVRAAVPARTPGPRGWLVMSSIIGACVVAAWQADLWIVLQADARAGTGESRIIRLSDGSRVTLDSRSAVTYTFDGAARHVRLLEGRARFDVARDPSRPFLVEVQGGVTRALGTSFIVDHTSAEVEVDAIVHDIAIRMGGREVVLHPGQTVRYADGIGSIEPARPGFDGWTSGIVKFDAATLAEIAADLQRYSSTRLVVLGSARDRRYSGVVRTSDVITGLDAIARSGGLSVTSLPGLVIITAR